MALFNEKRAEGAKARGEEGKEKKGVEGGVSTC